MDRKELVCIVCPKGCRLAIIKDEKSESGYRVEGNTCSRGEKYGIKELTNPTRVVTSTVKLDSKNLKRLPVRTNGDIPKDMIFDCMKIINSVEVKAKVKVGQIIVKNLLETGIDLVASRSVD